MKVEIKCSGSHELPLDALKDFQGNLKSLSKENYGKLKKEILELGFSEPFSVWLSKDGAMLLNGHQRARTLRAMKEEGIELPEKFPVSVVTAKDIGEAKRKVLALTSQYGEMESQGLYEFISEIHMPINELMESFRFPEINFDLFNIEFGGESLLDESAQSSLDKKNEVTCPKCGHEFTP